MAGEKSVFVTVGTTSFNELVAATTEKSFMRVRVPYFVFNAHICTHTHTHTSHAFTHTHTHTHTHKHTHTQLLVKKGYTHLTLQIGRGSFEPRTPPEVAGLQLEYYRFKPTLQEDMQRTSLIISHGGKEG